MDNVIGIKSKRAVTQESICREALLESVYALDARGYGADVLTHAAKVILDDMVMLDTFFNPSTIVLPYTLELSADVNSSDNSAGLELVCKMGGKRCVVWSMTEDTRLHKFDDSSLFDGPLAEMMVGMAVPAMAMLEDSRRPELGKLLQSYHYFSGYVIGVLRRLGWDLKSMAIVAHLNRAATETILYNSDLDETVCIREYSCELVRLLLANYSSEK